MDRHLKRGEIQRGARLLALLERALKDGDFAPYWPESQRRHAGRLLERMGVKLCSQTALAKLGHIVKQGARPVVWAYFGAPIQRRIGLFVFGVQTRSKKEGKGKQGCEKRSPPAVTNDESQG